MAADGAQTTVGHERSLLSSITHDIWQLCAVQLLSIWNSEGGRQKNTNTCWILISAQCHQLTLKLNALCHPGLWQVVMWQSLAKLIQSICGMMQQFMPLCFNHVLFLITNSMNNDSILGQHDDLQYRGANSFSYLFTCLPFVGFSCRIGSK